jgi:hypothetical protein
VKLTVKALEKITFEKMVDMAIRYIQTVIRSIYRIKDQEMVLN